MNQWTVIREPFMLLETVEMLYKAVNNLSFRNTLSRLQLTSAGARDDGRIRRLAALQQILDQVCQEVDPNDPQLRLFFARVESDYANNEDLCLARCLSYSFTSLQHTDLRENVREICRLWRSLQERGCWIQGHGVAGLEFSDGDGSPGDLFRQVCALDLPAEFRLQLYEALRNFEATMEQLQACIEPYARCLKQAYDRAPWLMEELAAYWDAVWQDKPPLAFLEHIVGKDVSFGRGDRTRIGYSLMNYDETIYDTAGVCLNSCNENVIYIGCALTSSSTVRHMSGDLDSVGTVLRSIGEKKRLEILRRLSRERSYCHELASSMGVDPGNMSRNLAVLYNYGFLRQEREALRNYYQTDREAVRKFLDLVEFAIFH